MLGWEVFVHRQTPEILLVRWTTGVFGLRWLDDLAKRGKAMDLGGNGYPNRYAIEARILLSILANGLPDNDSPLVIGDDYVLPSHWNGQLVWNREALAKCPLNEQLAIEAWDQS